MRKLMTLALATLALAGCKTSGRQEKSAPPPRDYAWEYWRNPDGYLDDQASVLFGLIDETVESNPATTDPSAERQLALAALDALVHDTRNDDSPALHAFLDRRMTRIAALLREKPKKKGVELFKLYNDGFIVRGGGVTVGFDLCGTRQGVKYIPDSLMQELVGRCDMLFISHRDPDHADAIVVEMASQAGIPVYGPEDYSNGKTQKIRMEDFGSRSLATRRTGTTLEVQALPGHQDDLQNNIYVVTLPNGCTVAHCGDQYSREDLVWLKDVSGKMARPLDILIIDCWAMELAETVTGFAPRLVVSGHENEMGHTIDHREAFWLTQYKFGTVNVPSVILCWGERFEYR